MLRHVRRWLTTVDENQCVVCKSRGHTMNSCFEVFFVPGQIHERDDPISLFGNLVVRFTFVGTYLITPRNRFSRRTKSHEMSCGRRCTSTFNFVTVFHNGGTTATAAIVQARCGQCLQARVPYSCEIFCAFTSNKICTFENAHSPQSRSIYRHPHSQPLPHECCETTLFRPRLPFWFPF